ncbi:MAG: hypothetical protein ABSD89_13705 [Halobacteriota archaeon]|jgi:hypothetical protein
MRGVRPLSNPDHVEPDWELAVMIGGMVVGWCIMIGSFVYLVWWWTHH